MSVVAHGVVETSHLSVIDAVITAGISRVGTTLALFLTKSVGILLRETILSLSNGAILPVTVRLEVLDTCEGGSLVEALTYTTPTVIFPIEVRNLIIDSRSHMLQQLVLEVHGVSCHT